jgi:hypothetical protein
MDANFHNWLGSANPFNLPKPPAWWLTRLHDQDEGLVVFPSALRVNTYVLARRREFSRDLHELFKRKGANVARPRISPDSDTLAAHNLVYVAHIVGGIGNWSETIFRQLKEGDTWAQGGASKVIEKIEGAELRADQRKHANLLDKIDHMARDAYRSYKARTGQRNQRSNTGPKAKIVPAGSL